MPANLIDLLTVVTLVLAAPPSPETASAPAYITGSIATPRAKAVDETALRYYAARKETARVEAETRRLQKLNSAWRPPTDLSESRLGSSDETALWQLLAADRLNDLRAAIKAQRDKDPAWTLSTELETKLRRKELRAHIIAGMQAKRWTDVASVAGNWQIEVDAGDIDVLWLVAESFAQSRRSADCRKVLESILVTSVDPRERIATIHKALALLPMRDAEDLIRSGKTDAAGVSEFAVIAIDITRARISALLHDTPGSDISPSELVSFQDYALGVTEPDQVALLAWYALKRNDLSEALEHFKSSIAKGGDATVAHGLAHTLRRLGRLRDAEEVAYAWREPSSANSILFIDILAEQMTRGSLSLEPERLTRYAEVTLQTASGEGAQALAWYAYRSCQLDAAAEWFKRANAWFPKQTTTFGHALVLRRLKRTQEFLELVNRYDGLFPMTIALLFPDELNQANEPCDRMTDNTVKTKPAFGTAAPRGIATVPTVAMLRPEHARERRGPKASEFPIAVSPENPYRSSSASRPIVQLAQKRAWRPADQPATVLEARRTAGVGPMPYEKYGIALLPGWNGVMQPAVSDDVRLHSPRGTPWSEQANAEIVQNETAFATAPLREAAAATRFHR